MKKILCIPISLILSLLAACNDKPEGVLSETKMVSLIADMETAESYIQTQGYNETRAITKERLTAYILEKHNISKADFDSTMTWYGRNIDEYQKLYAEVDKELIKRQKSSTGSAESLRSNDLWPYSRHLMINELSNTDNITFSIPASEIEKGDQLIWKMRLRSNSGGDLLFGVDYDNGSTTYITRNGMGNKRIDITLQTDTGKAVKRIYGYYRINSKGEMPMWIDSISLETLPFDSVQYYHIQSQHNYAGAFRKTATLSKDTISEGSTVSSENEIAIREDKNIVSPKTKMAPPVKPVLKKRPKTDKTVIPAGTIASGKIKAN